MRRSIKIGEHSIQLWLVVVLLLSGIALGVVGDYIWRTINIPLEVKEPLEILSYPSQLSLFAGETIEFNITVMNHASPNYTIILDFSLDNETYQNSYVTFSNETYIIVSGQQNITAWFEVKPYAPSINASLTINFQRIEEQVLFLDDFNDGVADGWTEKVIRSFDSSTWEELPSTWIVVDGEYFVTLGLIDSGISTVDDLNLTDCIIQTKLRFRETEVGFRAGIIFRFIDAKHYYSLELSNEYNVVDLIKYSPENSSYGHVLAQVKLPIDANIEYDLKIEIEGNTLIGYLNNQQIISSTDSTYISGKVGLRARRADVFFNNFTVTGTQ